MVFQNIMFSDTEELAIPLEGCPEKAENINAFKVLFVGKKTRRPFGQCALKYVIVSSNHSHYCFHFLHSIISLL